MKNLIKKRWFIGLIMGLAFGLYFVLALVSYQFKISLNKGEYSISELAFGEYNNQDFQIFTMILYILTWGSLLFIPLIVVAILKRKKYLFLLSHGYAIIVSFLCIIFQVLFRVVTTPIMIFNLISILIVFVSFVFLIASREQEEIEVQEEVEDLPKVNVKLASRVILINNILAFISIILTLVVPFTITYISKTIEHVILGETIVGTSDLLTSILFIVVFGAILASSVYLVYSLSYYHNNKNAFYNSSKNYMAISLSITIVYFFMGYFITFKDRLDGKDVITLSFIPLIVSFISTIINSIFRGRLINYNIYQEKKRIKYPKLLSLVVVILISLTTMFSLCLNVIRIQVESGSYNKEIALTGVKLLSDYPSLPGGYQVIAFALMIMETASLICLILCLAGYFSKNKGFKNLAQFTVILNVGFIFLYGISGLYFTVAQKVNEETINELIQTYIGFDVSEFTINYTAKTDLIYALALDVIILLVAILKNTLDRGLLDQNGPLEVTLTNDLSKPSAVSNQETLQNVEYENFDACEAFTELDNLSVELNKDLKLRKEHLASSESLSELAEFVVAYARNSRLHLSYTKESIVTFIAGLASSKLTILQGMSGTGKTSLPKIFSEAIYGNCNIIEVESSWKDKNELLGYYNEFSKKYTPKKFTQALYQAALTPEIPTFIVLDEMNLSRIEYYFSDFLSLMENEPDDRKIKLVNIRLERIHNNNRYQYLRLVSGHTLYVPKNIWFIGTANRDESTFVISDKVYDRAHTMNFDKRAPKVKSYTDPMDKRFYSYDMLDNMINKALNTQNFDVESSSTIKEVEKILSPFNISFGNRILNQIESFVKVYKAAYPNEDVEDIALETILLSKVVSKLEVKIIDDKEELMKQFEALGLNRCRDFISKLNED